MKSAREYAVAIEKLQKKKRKLQHIMQVTQNKQPKTTTPRQPKLSEQIKDHVIKRRYEDAYIAYRLTGTTLFQVKMPEYQDKLTGIRFDNHFKGQHVASFYIVLQPPPNIQVIKHTIPPGIPLDKLAKNYLHHEIKDFAEKMHQYLQAFVSRKEQFRLFQNPQVANAIASQAYDSISFNYRSGRGDQVFQIKLVYDHLLSMLPTRVKILTIQKDKRPKPTANFTEKARFLLSTKPLHEATNNISNHL